MAYVGQVRYEDEADPGEHRAIVDREVFDRVQNLLKRHGCSKAPRIKHAALLKNLIHCGTCGCGMTHSHAKRGTKLYRYYVCQRAQKRGRGECPSPSVPATEIERFVVDQIRCLGRDPELVSQVLLQAEELRERRTAGVQDEQKALWTELRNDFASLRRATESGDASLANLQNRIGRAQARLAELDQELAGLELRLPAGREITAALADFEPIWQCLAPGDQAPVIELLVECVAYNSGHGRISVTFRPCGIQAFTRQFGRGVPA